MLTARAKKDAAAELRRMAADLDRQAEADQVIDMARERVRRHRATRKKHLAELAHMIQAGAPLAVVRNHFPDWTEDQVQAMLKKARPLARRMAQNTRNREINHLAARGWTNRALAQKFGLSESQITRIISATWRPK